jgi:predicted nuclease with RNAse H fold
MAVVPASDITKLAAWASEARAIGIDAPAQLSTAPHRDDRSLSPKFAVARCAEIELGRAYGYWVPWVAPTGEPPGWIAAGLDLFHELRRRGSEPIEVYPYAGYRELVRPARLPRKTTAEGVQARVEALHRAGIHGDNLVMWSHDGLDALLAALIARDYAAGTAVAVSCGHDGSAIWLPAPARRVYF